MGQILSRWYKTDFIWLEGWLMGIAVEERVDEEEMQADYEIRMS